MEIKLALLRACVFSILLSACETWMIKCTDEQLLKVFEMKCYRRLLKIRWTQKITNIENLPRWLSWLRHSAHQPGRSVGGTGKPSA